MRNPAPLVFMAVFALLAPILPAVAQDVPGVVLFSSGKAGEPMPPAWDIIKINESKKLTEYKLADDGGTVVMSAVSAQSASAIGQLISVDLNKTPIAEWRWKISHLIKGADMEFGRTEDSPV